MNTEKDILKLVVAGHVDHGKSTVIGRLLYDTGSIPQGTIDKVRQIARETGKAFEFAYLLDAFEEEQKQGITIDITQLQFSTPKRDYLIIDAPGHKEFLKNMISGAASAEAAFLVIDAERGVEEQSKRHSYMLSLLGIRQICVIVNKMDLVGYSFEVYQKVKSDMVGFLASLGLEASAYIPLSALLGDNILHPSEKLGWHEGGTLVQALDALSGKKEEDENILRFPVQDVYKFDDRRIIAGRLESGRLRVGDEIVIYPGGKKTKILSLPVWNGKEDKIEAGAGESVGITVQDEFFNQRGEIISHAAFPPIVTRSFKASLFWMGKKPLLEKNRYKLKIATQEVTAEIDKVIRVIDASTLATEKESIQVNLNDVAEVVISTGRPIALDLFSLSQGTGRFVLVDGYDVAGGGIVVAAEQEKEAFSGFMEGGLKARCDLFEEYYYSVEERAVNKLSGKTATYSPGDVVPLYGLSFSYPEFFDVVLARERVAVKIRAGIVVKLVALENYEYEDLPVLNGQGFAYRVNSRAEWQACLAEYAAAGPDSEADLSSRWLNFTAYRAIPFYSNSWDI